LDRRESTAVAELTAAAARLTAARREAADRLGAAVDVVLPELGLPDGQFRAELVPVPEPTAWGAESVEFRTALNVGHDMRPLARVASGGELSRVMLALKTILARADRVPTLVFDEVDAGIGGRVGLQVGETMRRVAAHHQVFAITHLPQAVLSGDQRIDEIARMLGGDPESDVSRAHARELLEAATAKPSRTKRR
jgi:DNA repair protein RecN (Recombination protein N)